MKAHLKEVTNRLRIMLVQPTELEAGHPTLENVFWLFEPVALTSLAAMIPEHDVRILDLRLEPDTELSRVFLEFQPDIVGISATTTDCYQAKTVLQVAKSILDNDCFTFVSGQHATEIFDDNAIDAIAWGEGEITFQEIVHHLAANGSGRQLHHINGLLFRDETGDFTATPKGGHDNSLDNFPIPARHLIPERYRKEYFFTFLGGMASMETSRGCSFNTQYMTAASICDRLEVLPEKFVFFLDDKFLTDRERLEELCDEIELRGITKYYATRGHNDFIADNPELMRRLRDCGFIAVLSDYESNDKNALAARILWKLGIVSIGLFVLRPDFEEKDFDQFYQAINEMKVALPLVTIQSPMPGTKLSRERFLQKFAECRRVTLRSTIKGLINAMWRRPDFFLFHALRQSIKFIRKQSRYFRAMENRESCLRNDTVNVTAKDIVRSENCC